MKQFCLLFFVLCPLFMLLAFGPGGWNPGGGGGGGWNPGGGGNQPDQPGGGGGGGTFVYDTFLTDSTTSGGCIVYGNLMTGYVAGQNTVTIPSSATKIADGALSGNESVTKIDATAATGLAEMPEAFAAGCGSLAEVALPSTVTVVGASAFAMDSALATFSGDGVATVGDYAFFGCRSLVLSDACGFSSIGEAALTGVSYASEDGDVYCVEAAPLVSWIKADGAAVAALPTRPKTYSTEDLRTWLANDVANLESYLYAEEIATNANFTALSVSGTTFRFAAQDLATLSVAHAALQVSTDLNTWKTVSESDVEDGAYAMPSSTNGFARIVYTLLW